MPVLVTGSQQPLARQIAARLLDEGGEVRVHGRGDVAALRAAGAIVASGDADDEGHLESSLAQVHTVVHVGRGLHAPSPEVLIAEAMVLARAAANADVRRLVGLSLPGAGPGASDPLRRAAGEVEAVLAACPVPTVVVRLSLVDTPAVRDALATAGLSEEERSVTIAPVRPQDVVEAVVGFDRARSTAARGHVVFAADGPETASVGDHLERIGARSPGSGSLVGRRALDPARVPMLRPSLRGPWTTSPSEGLPDAWSFTGVTPASPGAA